MNDRRDIPMGIDDSTDEQDANFDRIRQLFDSDEQSVSPERLNKQILAAAHREAVKPLKPQSYSISWWRKLALPVYVSAGFLMTVLAYKSLWPSDAVWKEGEESNRFSIEISSEQGKSNSAQNPTSISKERKRLKRKSPPNMSPIKERPESYASDRENNRSIAITHEEARKASEVEPSQPIRKVYTGNSMVKVNYPEKQAWADKIIQQLKNGEFDRAKQEMNDFKKIYPEYPIEEQVKVFIP